MKPFEKYRITRLFTEGNLKGIEYTEETDVLLELGKTYVSCAGGDHYRIIKVEYL